MFNKAVDVILNYKLNPLQGMKNLVVICKDIGKMIKDANGELEKGMLRLRIFEALRMVMPKLIPYKKIKKHYFSAVKVCTEELGRLRPDKDRVIKWAEKEGVWPTPTKRCDICMDTIPLTAWPDHYKSKKHKKCV